MLGLLGCYTAGPLCHWELLLPSPQDTVALGEQLGFWTLNTTQAQSEVTPQQPWKWIFRSSWNTGCHILCLNNGWLSFLGQAVHLALWCLSGQGRSAGYPWWGHLGTGLNMDYALVPWPICFFKSFIVYIWVLCQNVSPNPIFLKSLQKERKWRKTLSLKPLMVQKKQKV